MKKSNLTLKFFLVLSGLILACGAQMASALTAGEVVNKIYKYTRAKFVVNGIKDTVVKVYNKATGKGGEKKTIEFKHDIYPGGGLKSNLALNLKHSGAGARGGSFVGDEEFFDAFDKTREERYEVLKRKEWTSNMKQYAEKLKTNTKTNNSNTIKL